MLERFVHYHGGVTTPEPVEHLFPSTTWQWKKVKIKPPPAGHDTARAKRGPWRRFGVWPRHRPLVLTVRHRGGSESWWLVEARGSHAAFPGHLALEDVMRVVLNETRWTGQS
jgi:hypothetical protein